MNITLDDTPNGFSGYTITVTLLEPSVGEITAVAFPGWANRTDNSFLPASSVWMKGCDHDPPLRHPCPITLQTTLPFRPELRVSQNHTAFF